MTGTYQSKHGPVEGCPVSETPIRERAWTDGQITAAARALCDRSAEVCNVNPQDNWNLYANEFIEDAKVALNATIGPAMTARLRELAERWKRRASLSNGNGDLAFANNKCATELISILDAEGDGGAVGCLTISRFRGSDAMVNHDFDYYGNLPDGSYSVYIHPTRSGGVSDADVERGLEMMFGVTGKDADVYRPGMRAALTHFAKGERHD